MSPTPTSPLGVEQNRQPSPANPSGSHSGATVPQNLQPSPPVNPSGSHSGATVPQTLQPSPPVNPSGSHSGATVPQKRPFDDLPNNLTAPRAKKPRGWRRPILTLTTDEIIEAAKQKGLRYFDDKVLDRCAECITVNKPCDIDETGVCKRCQDLGFECKKVPRQYPLIKRCDYCYAAPTACSQYEPECTTCVKFELECTWVLKGQSAARHKESMANRAAMNAAMNTAMGRGRQQPGQRGEVSSPPPALRNGKRRLASETQSTGVQSDAVTANLPSDTGDVTGDSQSTGVPSDAVTVNQASINTATTRKRRRLGTKIAVDTSTETTAQPTPVPLVEKSAQHLRCPYQSAPECVMHNVKTAATNDKLFAKYMHLCRVAHANGNGCVPGSIISNYGESLTWLIQRDSGEAEDKLLGLRLSIPHCEEHTNWGRLKQDSEHIPFVVAGSLHDVEEAYGTDAAVDALAKYLDHPGTIFPFGKTCHQSTCVQVSHLATAPAPCHRQYQMDELRLSSQEPVIPASCDHGCLPQQAIKTSQQLLIEAFCLIHHIDDAHDPGSWSDEMIGGGIHSDAHNFLSNSLGRDHFIMLSFTPRGKLQRNPIKHIINKIASLNGNLLEEVDPATVDNKYAFFEMSYFPETPFFAPGESGSTKAVATSDDDTSVASNGHEDEIIVRDTDDEDSEEYTD